MDDHEYDGASRSANYEQQYASSSFPQEVYVPSGAKKDLNAKRPATHSNLIQLRRETPARDHHAPQDVSEIVGSSNAAKLLRDTIDLYADDDSPVLVNGETGVGEKLPFGGLDLDIGADDNLYVLGAVSGTSPWMPCSP